MTLEGSDGGFDVFVGARKAASIIVLRDRPDGGGVEVLMLRRAERDNDPRSGVAVFPGGVLDRRDADAHRHCLGWDDAAASAKLGLPQGGLDYLVAAARECFEEVGLLFVDGDAPTLARAHADWRTPMQGGDQPIAAMCEALGVHIDLRGWAYFSHWLTPPGNPKRFDTRFFVARAPAGQEAVADLGEAVDVQWLTPADALDEARALKLMPVTRRTLMRIGAFPTVQAVLDHAAAQVEVPMTMPRRVASRGAPKVVLPGEWAYAEVGKLDPTGRGDVSAELVAGVPVRLSPRLLRVTAPNPGVMTGPGTNSYLVGDPQANRWTVVDPGPADDRHLHALLAAAPGPIERILCTHTHVDHSPGAVALAAETGAPVWGRRAAYPAGQDPAFAPVHEPADDERIVLGPTTTLRAVHTPGHASNHLCFLIEEERTLLTGDHVMQGSTVVINPPDGDMGAYLRALRRLLELPVDWLAPGHGFLVADPPAVVNALIAHRLGREGKVVKALQSHGPATLAALVPVVYDDVPAALHPVARRSLLAHLLKLQEDGAAQADGEVWAAMR